METNKIICGDNMKVMAGFPPDSFDTIITDPPYGLGFMGKDWDTFKGDYITKGLKVDKASFDRRKNKTFDHKAIGSPTQIHSPAAIAGQYDYSRNYEFQQAFTIWGIEALRVLKPGGTLLIFGGTRTYHRLACAIEDAGFILKDCIMWLYGSGFPKATDISKQLDKGHKREVVRTVKRSGKVKGTYGQFEGNNKETTPATPEAQLWNGWKSHGLKPAYEPILVAMKPNDGTYANNALKWGVSGLNIDGGKIPFKSEADKKSAVFGRGTDILGGNYVGAIHGTGETNIPPDDKGRFPANVILDEVAAAMLDEQSGERPAGGKVTGRQKSCTGDTGIYGHYEAKENSPFNDTGGASRFFYCAKASKRERNAGCKGLAVKDPDNRSDTGKGSYTEKGIAPQRNHHPTVKPLALMEYLCKLTMTPTGGVVLDPYFGSGTTGIACINTGRDFVGIEKEPEYVEIARRRIEWAKGQMPLFAEQGK